MTPDGTRCEPTTGWYSETGGCSQAGCLTSVYQDGRLCYSLRFGGAAPLSGKLVIDPSGAYVGYMGAAGEQWACSLSPTQQAPADCATWYSLVTPTADCVHADVGTCVRPF
jgi:hypothetical protein